MRGKTPVYANRGKHKGWWAALVEKAAAKLYGSYFQMDGGKTEEAFYLLTGLPSISFNVNG